MGKLVTGLVAGVSPWVAGFTHNVVAQWTHIVLGFCDCSGCGMGGVVPALPQICRHLSGRTTSRASAHVDG